MNSGSPTTELSEVELLAEIARGSTQAFGQFYDRLSGLLFSMAVRILHDPAGAEDVVQEVFVQIWEKAATYDVKLGKPLTWAITLTRNRAIDRLRSAQRRQGLTAKATEEAAATGATSVPARPAVGFETGKLIRTAISELPDEQREAIELAFFGGLTQAEIAAKLGQPIGTVKARIRRGMLKLRDTLGGHL